MWPSDTAMPISMEVIDFAIENEMNRVLSLVRFR